MDRTKPQNEPQPVSSQEILGWCTTALENALLLREAAEVCSVILRAIHEAMDKRGLRRSENEDLNAFLTDAWKLTDRVDEQYRAALANWFEMFTSLSLTGGGEPPRDPHTVVEAVRHRACTRLYDTVGTYLQWMSRSFPFWLGDGRSRVIARIREALREGRVPEVTRDEADTVLGRPLQKVPRDDD